MISFDEALQLIHEIAHPLGSELVPLAQAHGRVLAAPLVAQVDSPRADCSSMDGYAVRDGDLPGTLEVIGESFAGGVCERAIEPGTCIRIFTGATLPEGADRVVIQEDVERSGDQARVPACPAAPRYIRRRGSDFEAGEVLIEAGRGLTARALVTAAAADLAAVEAYRRPKVSILATGDELVTPGEARLRPERIPDSVSCGVAALARDWGAEVIAMRRVRDDLAALEDAAARAVSEADVVMVAGGASVGERDFARTMFAPLGLELVFSKVSIKPGKPVWLGRCEDRLVLGLPGNPTSAMVTARLMLAPLLAGLGGRGGALEWTTIPLAGPLAACGERETFARARRTAQGAMPIGNQDSGVQGALAQSDLLIRCRPFDPPRQAGDLVEATAF